MKTTLILASTAALLLSACGTTSQAPLASNNGSTPSTVVAGGVKPYPLDTCIVTGNKLGSMGPVITQVYQGQQVKFCCKPCVKKFAANPAKYLADL